MAKWDISVPWQPMWAEKALHLAPQVSFKRVPKKATLKECLVLFLLDHIWDVLSEAFRHEMAQNVTEMKMADLDQV